jgi:hypothetical protein
MTSERKILANQINGKKSRGPQSWAGKMRVRYNAARHGLSTIHQFNPVYADEIADLAKRFCEGLEEYPDLVEQAILIAEGTVVLRYVRLEQAATIDRFRDPSAVDLKRPGGTVAQARARLKELDDADEELTRLEDVAEATSESAAEVHVPANGKLARLPETERGRMWEKPKERDEDEAICAALPVLKRLSRYERRAWSRRNRALRRFMEIEIQLAEDADAAAGRSASVHHKGGDSERSI